MGLAARRDAPPAPRSANLTHLLEQVRENRPEPSRAPDASPSLPLSAPSSCGHQASKLLGAPRPSCPTPLALQSTGTLREDGDGKGGGEEVCTEEDDQSATAPGLPINSRGTSELSSVMVAHWARGDPGFHSDSRPRALPQTL